MGETESENTKTANQAWRKRPRRFAPKSRLGCKTCKIRRIKCDLARPSCVKCQSTGRTCDGYGETSLVVETEIRPIHDPNERLDEAGSWDNHQTLTRINPHHRKQWHMRHHQRVVSPNLRPFMILPAAESGQTEAMGFFEYISIKHLNEYYPCDSWRNTLMYFSQTVPAVRYAAMALALVQRNHVSSHRIHQPRQPDTAALYCYNRAIQLLLTQDLGDSPEGTAITLLVCYLFTCFDHMAGNHPQAMRHLRGGVELSRNVDQALLSISSNTYSDAQPSGPQAFIRQVASRIRRLDLQAVLFLIDWTPADIQETLTSHSLPLTNAFESPEEATDHLHILIARVMRLRWTEQETPSTGDISAALKGIVLRQLETWHRLFDNMLRQAGISNNTDFTTSSLISLLRLQYTMAWTYLSSFGPGREMEYDAFLPQFEQCVAMASDVAAAHEQYSGSLKPTFTPEIGIVPLLYIIGAKCRHPRVRREVLGILGRQPIREAAWDSIQATKVVELIIKIEEGGCGEGQMIQSMEQIPVSQRIEILWWTHVVSANRLDVRYTICMQEEWHAESLMM
ncbi:hypothetical protein F5Y08DRAFT_328917 [Xylaria arbuscula]|nr:hypothetical protein F5Y08DRAFT_328917 [Xylaria arbuscula]